MNLISPYEISFNVGRSSLQDNARQVFYLTISILTATNDKDSI